MGVLRQVAKADLPVLHEHECGLTQVEAHVSDNGIEELVLELR